MQKAHYELLYIIPAKYTETELIPVKEMVAGIVKKYKGEITREDNTMGKRKLAYPIKNAIHGYYCLYEFDVLTENLMKLNDELRHTPELLRHIIVKVDANRHLEIKKEMEKAELAKAQAEEKKNTKPETKSEEKTKAPKKTEEPKEAKPISMEELNKSLDEILKDDVI